MGQFTVFASYRWSREYLTGDVDGRVVPVELALRSWVMLDCKLSSPSRLYYVAPRLRNGTAATSRRRKHLIISYNNDQ